MEPDARVHNHFVKLQFTLEPNSWHGSTHETVWAEEVSHGKFKIKNSPFYVFGVSLNDVVAATEIGESGVFEFNKKLVESGHSTYRIIPLVERGRPELAHAISEMNRLGAFYEEGPSQLLAFDVPPTADIKAIYKLMDTKADAGVWDFEEGHYSHAD